MEWIGGINRRAAAKPKPDSTMHTLLKTIGWIALFYLIWCLALFFLQRRMLFPRDVLPSDMDAAAPPGQVEIQWLATAAGKVETWYLPPRSAGPQPAPAVIFAHGNAELIDFNPPELQPLIHKGFAVLLVEYPGYGRSAGNPSQQSITEVMIAAYDMLIADQRIDADRIVFFGRSLGGGAVCALSIHRPAAAMILVSTFTSVRDMAMRYLVPPIFVRDPFDNRTALQQYEGPVLLIHGRRDTIIPFSHAQRLKKAASNATLVAYDCGHNDLPPDPQHYWQTIFDFLERSIQMEPSGVTS
jgi:pimeloyl-ACP methyl ester carboxylesterase